MNLNDSIANWYRCPECGLRIETAPADWIGEDSLAGSSCSLCVGTTAHQGNDERPGFFAPIHRDVGRESHAAPVTPNPAILKTLVNHDLWTLQKDAEVDSHSDPMSTTDCERRQPEIPGFKIKRTIAQGGMGVVYEADDLQLNRRVAIKALLPNASLDTMNRKRFELEAAALAQLEHPNIVRLYDVIWAEQRPYMVLEYAEISNLDDVIRLGTIPSLTSAWLVERIAHALQFAHDDHIVHRDLKPSNILLDRAEKSKLPADDLCQMRSEIVEGMHHKAFGVDCIVPKIADFGLVGHLTDSVTNTRLTEVGVLIGTPGYLAPESISQAAGHATSQVDVYGLGGVLYACLTGKAPYSGSNLAEVIQKILNEELVPPKVISPSVPDDLNTICLKCLEKKPADRYQSAAEVAEDLRRFQADMPILAKPPGIIRRVMKWQERNRCSSVLTVLFLILGCLTTMTVANSQFMLLEKDKESQMQALLKEEALKISGQLKTKMVVVQSLAAHISCQADFSFTEFEIFCHSLISVYEEFQALEWAPRVTPAERQAHEAWAREHVTPDYRIHGGENSAPEIEAADSHADYFPVLVAYPKQGNEQAIGLNLAFERQRKSALQLAIQNKRAGISGPINLVQDQAEEKALLGFVPVWKQPADGWSEGKPVGQKQDTELRGLVVGVFRVSHLIGPVIDNWSLAGTTPRYAIEIHDVTEQKALLFSSLKGERVHEFQDNSKSVPLDLHGRSWEVTFYARHGNGNGMNDSIRSIVAIGFLLTLLAAGAPVFISLLRKHL